MKIQFRDVTNLNVPDWVVKPFQVDIFQNEAAIQENLMDLENDQEAQATFRTSGWHAMWATHSQHFPTLWEKARILFLAFPTSYLVEQAFSQVLHMQPKYRNRLNLIPSGALRLKLTSIRPSVKK